MASPYLESVLQQLMGQIPIFVSCLAGIVVSLIFVRRYPAPSVLTMIAAGVFLAATVGQTAVVQYLILVRARDGGPYQPIGSAVAIVSIATSFLRAGSLGLLVTAVFVRRGTR